MTMAKLSMTIKCTLSAICSGGHGSPPVQNKAHPPMQHIYQGYSRRHWMPPLSNYLLYIAPAATRATANKMMMKKCTKKTGHFDGHGNALVRKRAHHPMKEVQGLTKSH
jgi:hypothetical protein